MMSNKIALFCCALSLVTLFFGVASLYASQHNDMPLDLRRVLAKAQKAIEKKSYISAENILVNYLERNSNNPHYLAYYVLGNAYYLDNKTMDSYRAYLKAYKLNSSYRPVCINLAKISYDLRKYKKAAELFLHAYEISEKPDPELLYEAGATYFHGKMYRAARRVLERLLNRNKNIKESWLKLFVFTCLELKDWNTAQRYLLTLLNKKRTNVTYWKLLAQVRLQKGDYKGAAGALEIAYRLEPPSSKRWKDLAGIYFYIGIPLKAARCLEKAYGNDPSPRELDEIARAYAQAHRIKKAVTYYQRTIAKKPTDSRWLEIAKLYYRNGMWKKAIAALKKSIKLNPGNGLTYLLLGHCAWQVNDKVLAIRSFTQASRYKRYKDQALAALDMVEESLDE